ncbi:MAG: hypothetical protein KDI48_19885, partial [Xanthomonadales bacterium]|nr:hypothetical protein [Xanthomonadales bacterium]
MAATSQGQRLPRDPDPMRPAAQFTLFLPTIAPPPERQASIGSAHAGVHPGRLSSWSLRPNHRLPPADGLEPIDELR